MITLLALILMLQPSDIAPHSGIPFLRSGISEGQQGTLIIYLHGIKHDASRDGFRVVLTPSSNSLLCPVDTLLMYLMCTAVHAGGASGPVFLTLVSPCHPLKADTVAGVLNYALHLAGIQGFSAKNFCPTSATRAVEMGSDPEQVRALGRWRNVDIFLKHYVHATLAAGLMDAILGTLDDAKVESSLVKKDLVKCELSKLNQWCSSGS